MYDLLTSEYLTVTRLVIVFSAIQLREDKCQLPLGFTHFSWVILLHQVTRLEYTYYAEVTGLTQLTTGDSVSLVR